MPVEVRHRDEVSPGLRSAGTDGRLVYAVGDVHGRYDLLVPLLRALVDDAARLAPERPPRLVFLGDYVDRGPQSAEVVTTLIWLSRHADFDLTFLKGNHEAMMLSFLHQPETASGWLRAGGAETLRSYGVEGWDETRPDALGKLRDEFMDRLPTSHLAFLQTLEGHAAVGDYAFVHAGLRPGIALRRQADADLLWIREEFLEARQAFEKIVVHGHSWTSKDPVVTPHRVGVDTGAYHTGVLTAVRLGAGEIGFIQASDEELGSPDRS